MDQRKTCDDKPVKKGDSTPQHQTESANAVFNNPLLMDKVVKYSIYNSSGKRFNKSTIITIRLVNKTWLQSASRVLKSSSHPVILLQVGLKIGKNTVNNVVYDNDKANILDHFLSVFSKTNSRRRSDSFLPIYLAIEQFYLIKRNFKNLRSFFEHCAGLIIGIHVEYPLDGGLANFKCNNLKFPFLRYFEFKFKTWKDAVTLEPKHPLSDSHVNGMKLIQQILQNSKTLQRFSLKNHEEAGINISCLSLPETLKSATFSRPLTSQILTTYTKYQMPNLNALELTIGTWEEVPLMHKILEHFRNQLEQLSLNVRTANDDEDSDDDEEEEDEGEDEEEEPIIYIELPFMEKLQRLTLSGDNIDFSPRFREVWPKRVPNLTRLVLKDLQTEKESFFAEWIEGFKFDTVTKLKFVPDYFDDDRFWSPSVENISEILASFPNIQKLTLNIQFVDTSSVKFLFRNFKHLQKLHLDFVFDEPDITTGYKVVSLFLGTSLELATALVNETENIVSLPGDNPESIMNLKELCSLTLSSASFYCPGRPTDPLCSEVFSRLGLEKMNSLRKIKLLGGFEIQ